MKLLHNWVIESWSGGRGGKFAAEEEARSIPRQQGSEGGGAGADRVATAHASGSGSQKEAEPRETQSNALQTS
jgi:hypothetical protein